MYTRALSSHSSARHASTCRHRRQWTAHSFGNDKYEEDIRVSFEDFGGEEALYDQRLYVAAQAVVQ